MTLADSKLQAKAALESLIAQCQRELQNMERFDDDRQTVATYDLQVRFNYAVDAAETFNATYSELAYLSSPREAII